MKLIKVTVVVLIVIGYLVSPDGAVARKHCTRPLGTAGADTLFGSPRRDVLCGFAGADTIDPDTGRDIARGGADDDTLDVSDGEANDVVRGGPGIHDTCAADVGDKVRGCEIVNRT